jgi:outer membrane protein TolC
MRTGTKSLLTIALSAHYSILLAQTRPPSSPSSMPLELPLSGKQSQTGSVSTTQSTTNTGGGNSVNLLNSSINVQGQYSGSTASGTDTGSVIPLRLDYALNLAFRNNLGGLSQNNATLQAQGARRVALSTLLPNIDSAVTENVQQINLRTLGVSLASLPSVVGPFNYFDARAARLNQTILDFVRLRNLKSANETVLATKFSARDARDLIVLAVGGAYLQLIASNARIAAAQAQVDSSRAVYQQATERLKAGVAARIDVTRTQVQLQTDQQRLRSLLGDHDRQMLVLSRAIGLPLGQAFSIADDFPFSPLTDLTFDQALEQANRDRSDLKAAQTSVRAAAAARKAAHDQALPSVNLYADYGAAGLRPTADAHGTFTITGTLTIPLYQGGRIRGQVEEARAVESQRQAELDDLRGQVDRDVRQAFIDLNVAADQVSVAKSNVDLAHDTLVQARDRFGAGVADTVEVVQAQQTVVQAENDYIGAVFEHNLAKVSLARALGGAEDGIRRFLPRK